MSDDKREPGGQDSRQVSVGDEYEVYDRAERCGVSRDWRVIAVSQVGNEASAFEAHLSAFQAKVSPTTAAPGCGKGLWQLF